MRTVLYAILASFAITLPAVAQPIRGANDPALRIAAQRWLESEDPHVGLWELGEFAADGNIAARMLVNGIFSIRDLLGGPELDHDGWLALVPEDHDARNRFRSRPPYRMDYAEVPALAALASDHDDRIDSAERMWAAGLHERFVVNWMTMVTPGDIINVEMVQFAESVIPQGSDAQLKLLVLRAKAEPTYRYYLATDPQEAEAFLARWDGIIWSEDHNAQMIAAVRDNRISVVMSLDFLNRLEHGDFDSWNVTDAQLRWGYAQYRIGESPLLSPSELEAFGAIVMDESTLTPSWRPIVKACTAACEDQVLECVGIAGLTRANRLIENAAIYLEPAIPATAFYDADKAAHIARGSMILDQENRQNSTLPLPETHLLPQCLLGH